MQQPSAGLFDKIICAVRIEEEMRRTRKILQGFMAVLALSLASMPLSLVNFLRQWNQSGSGYFIATAVEDWDLWGRIRQYAIPAILESLPVAALLLLALNLALVIFTVRLFLHRRGLLIKYIQEKFA